MGSLLMDPVCTRAGIGLLVGEGRAHGLLGLVTACWWLGWVLPRQAVGLVSAHWCVRLVLGLVPSLWWVKLEPRCSGTSASSLVVGARSQGFWLQGLRGPGVSGRDLGPRGPGAGVYPLVSGAGSCGL